MKTREIKLKRFFLIGNLDYGNKTSKYINGQSIKMRYLKSFFDTIDSPSYYDTARARKFPWSLLAIIYKIPQYSSIIVSLDKNGLKYLLPFVFFWSKIFKRKLYFFAVGGYLADFVKTNRLTNYALKGFERIFVESKMMVRKLEEQGYDNVRYLFNFKTYTFKHDDISVEENKKELKMIFISRVIWEKGLDVISRISETIDTEKHPITIDIYGPFENEDKTGILSVIQERTCLKYCGIIEPDNVHNVMSRYDCLLFPTHFDDEGFPGVILDAFITGIPVIASNWKYNQELVTSDVGFVFDLNNEDSIIEYSLKIYRDPKLLYQLKLNSYNNRKQYSIDKAKEILRIENVI